MDRITETCVIPGIVAKYELLSESEWPNLCSECGELVFASSFFLFKLLGVSGTTF